MAVSSSTNPFSAPPAQEYSKSKTVQIKFTYIKGTWGELVKPEAFLTATFINKLESYREQIKNVKYIPFFEDFPKGHDVVNIRATVHTSSTNPRWSIDEPNNPEVIFSCFDSLSKEKLGKGRKLVKFYFENESGPVVLNNPDDFVSSVLSLVKACKTTGSNFINKPEQANIENIPPRVKISSKSNQNEILSTLIKGSIAESVFKLFVQNGRMSEENYLSWEDRFLGYTDYIDQIKSSDMKGKNKNWGIDKFNRLFLTIKLTCTRSEIFYNSMEDTSIEDKEEGEGSLTIFQRATESEFVACAMNVPYLNNFCASTFNFSSEDFLKNLEALLKGQPIIKKTGIVTETIALAQ